MDTCDSRLAGNECNALPNSVQWSYAADPNVYSRSFMEFFAYTLNLSNHIIIFIVTIGLCWTCLKMKLEKTAMHAFLCTLGFVFLSAEGMMVRYGGNLPTKFLDSETKTSVHFYLQLIGGILGIVGTAHKSIAKEKHFTTWHGKIGIASCVFFLINLILGCAGIFFPHYLNLTGRNSSNLLHNGLGLIAFTTVMLAQYLGYETGFFNRNYVYKKSYKFLTIVIFILTILGPYKLFMKKISEKSY